MVVYFKSDVENPPVTLFMGNDKYENEDLIKWGWPEDVWFHVDQLSSAHVYLRLAPGQTVQDISPAVLEDAGQLVKANSISGCKMNEVDVVYTMWSNLRKTPEMDVGQVGFHSDKEVRKLRISKNSVIVKRLEKTREVDPQPDLRNQREERDRNEREGKKKQQREEMTKRKEEERRRKEEAEMKSYSTLMKSENMKSNQGGDGSDSDDFM
ncbi:coiled-coil domain-containing protein 25-like [Frankliniella occidentalis]|uniref:Coiled-coil domain-containing protein 25 n=2 Tax=Frankliniella occidentalis TaxID=133901 RepID=A0A9C6XB30_FRAOC|nr:coiled-coil domain-containing protein 25-like [Frankliniella occidentalis]